MFILGPLSYFINLFIKLLKSPNCIGILGSIRQGSPTHGLQLTTRLRPVSNWAVWAKQVRMHLKLPLRERKMLEWRALVLACRAPLTWVELRIRAQPPTTQAPSIHVSGALHVGASIFHSCTNSIRMSRRHACLPSHQWNYVRTYAPCIIYQRGTAGIPY